MSTFRRLLYVFAFLAGLGLLLALIAISPVVQTWYVQRTLERIPGTKVTVEDASFGFSSLQLSNVQVERGGAVLTIPDLHAEFPVKAALLQHKLLLRAVTAKGWVLVWREPAKPTVESPANASGGVPTPAAEPPTPTASPAGEAPAAAFRGLLRGAELPSDVSLDHAELEGDAVFRDAAGEKSRSLHVVVQGGGLAAGATAAFNVTATAADLKTGRTADIQGELRLGLTDARALNRAEFRGTVGLDGQPPAGTLDASVATVDAAGHEQYRLELSRGDQRLVAVDARVTPDGARLTGDWQCDADSSEVWPDLSGPRVHAKGAGRFESDFAFRDVHFVGQLTSTLTTLPGLALPTGTTATVTADLDATHAGTTLRIDRAHVVLGAPAAIGTVELLRPFTVDEKTRQPTLPSGTEDLVAMSLRRFPLSWLPPAAGGLGFSGGELTGEFRVRSTTEGFAVRSTAPIHATRLAIHQANHPLGENIDLSGAFTAEHTQKSGWLLRLTSGALGRAGRRLAALNADLGLSPDEYGRVPFHATWSADADALAESPIFGASGHLPAQSEEGELTLNLGPAADINAKLHLTARDPAQSITATLSAGVDDYRAAKFTLPITIGTGATATALSVEGTWARKPGEQPIDIQVSAPKIGLAQLRLLAAAIPVAPKVSLLSLTSGQLPAATPARDARPFWGDLTGRVRCDFRQVSVGESTLQNVGATLGFESDGLTLRGGQAVYFPLRPDKVVPRHDEDEHPMALRSAISLQGKIGFDAAAATPYNLDATFSVDQFDATRLFGAPPGGQDPQIEGHFGLAATYRGTGANLVDLLAHRREQFKVTSDAGILRLLKTSVAEAIPDAPEGAKDKIEGVGYAVGSIFGLKEKPSTHPNLAPATEAVLNVTYTTKELGYEKLSATATRAADGTIHLDDIVIEGPRVHLTGSGLITAATGVPLPNRPLALTLQVAFHDTEAERLAKAHLLTLGVDRATFVPLRVPLAFGGTLAKINNTAWHDLLLRAATAK